MATPALKAEAPAADSPLDAAAMMPKIILGETRQGILTTRYVPPSVNQVYMRNERFHKTALKSFLQCVFSTCRIAIVLTCWLWILETLTL